MAPLIIFHPTVLSHAGCLFSFSISLHQHVHHVTFPTGHSHSPSGSVTWTALSIQQFIQSSIKTFGVLFVVFYSSDVYHMCAAIVVSHVRLKRLQRRLWWALERLSTVAIYDIIFKSKVYDVINTCVALVKTWYTPTRAWLKE